MAEMLKCAYNDPYSPQSPTHGWSPLGFIAPVRIQYGNSGPWGTVLLPVNGLFYTAAAVGAFLTAAAHPLAVSIALTATGVVCCCKQ